jgi:hypothetical protein
VSPASQTVLSGRTPSDLPSSPSHLSGVSTSGRVGSSGSEDIFGSEHPRTSDEDIFGSEHPGTSAEDIFGSEHPRTSAEDIFGSEHPRTSAEDIFGSEHPRTSAAPKKATRKLKFAFRKKKDKGIICSGAENLKKRQPGVAFHSYASFELKKKLKPVIEFLGQNMENIKEIRYQRQQWRSFDGIEMRRVRVPKEDSGGLELFVSQTGTHVPTSWLPEERAATLPGVIAAFTFSRPLRAAVLFREKEEKRLLPTQLDTYSPKWRIELAGVLAKQTLALCDWGADRPTAGWCPEYTRMLMPPGPSYGMEVLVSATQPPIREEEETESLLRRMSDEAYRKCRKIGHRVIYHMLAYAPEAPRHVIVLAPILELCERQDVVVEAYRKLNDLVGSRLGQLVAAQNFAQAEEQGMIERLSSGRFNDTYKLLAAEGNKLILRVGKGYEVEQYEREHDLTELMGYVGLGAPVKWSYVCPEKSLAQSIMSRGNLGSLDALSYGEHSTALFFSDHACVLWAKAIIEAFGKCVSLGVVHMDASLRNIVLNVKTSRGQHERQVWLIDWDLAYIKSLNNYSVSAAGMLYMCHLVVLMLGTSPLAAALQGQLKGSKVSRLSWEKIVSEKKARREIKHYVDRDKFHSLAQHYLKHEDGDEDRVGTYAFGPHMSPCKTNTCAIARSQAAAIVSASFSA